MIASRSERNDATTSVNSSARLVRAAGSGSAGVHALETKTAAATASPLQNLRRALTPITAILGSCVTQRLDAPASDWSTRRTSPALISAISAPLKWGGGRTSFGEASGGERRALNYELDDT